MDLNNWILSLRVLAGDRFPPFFASPSDQASVCKLQAYSRRV